MEHTNEFLSRMFAAYMGCEAKYSSDDSIYTIGGVSISEGMAQFEWSRNVDWWNITDETKLILSPLSAITDEHAIEVAKIVTKGYCRHFTEGQITFGRVDETKRIGVFRNGAVDNIVSILPDGILYYTPEHDIKSTMGDLSVSNRVYFVPNAISAYDFLRSKSYDCGFQHIKSLIEAGLALNSKS